LVAIARAIAARPSVLLLDEPAAGLGSDDTQHLGLLIRRLADEMQLAILLVEHDVTLVSDVCDRVLALELGRVIAEGRPADVLRPERVERSYCGEDSAKRKTLKTAGTGRGSPATYSRGEPLASPRAVGARDRAGRPETNVASGAGPSASTPLLAAAGLHAGYG